MITTNLEQNLIRELNVSLPALGDRLAIVTEGFKAFIDAIPRIMFWAYNAGLVVYHVLVCTASISLLLTIALFKATKVAFRYLHAGIEIAIDFAQGFPAFVDGFVSGFQKEETRPPYHHLGDYLLTDEE